MVPGMHERNSNPDNEFSNANLETYYKGWTIADNTGPTGANQVDLTYNSVMHLMKLRIVSKTKIYFSSTLQSHSICSASD